MARPQSLVFEGTEQLFTDAVNASFDPVARYGTEDFVTQYHGVADRLPINTEGLGVEGTGIDVRLAVAYNAIFALRVARRTNAIDRIEDPRLRADTFNTFVRPTIHFVTEAVVLAQRYLAEERYPDGYLNRPAQA